MEDEYSPVPIEQRPIEEFIEISNSWFFNWPLQKTRVFYTKLLISWLIGFLIFITINTGSYYLLNHRNDLLLTSLIYSLSFPFIILARQYLGWRYIYQRLINDIIEYEESDWHDGQKWKKPLKLQQKDELIANFEVMPTITRLKKLLHFIIVVFTSCLASYLLTSNNQLFLS